MNKNLKEGTKEYAVIVMRIAKEYDNSVTVEKMRVDHNELDFMEDDEISELLQQANEIREENKEIEIKRKKQRSDRER